MAWIDPDDYWASLTPAEYESLLVDVLVKMFRKEVDIDLVLDAEIVLEDILDAEYLIE